MMIDKPIFEKRIFENLDPHVMEYRRDWRGRFASGGGGGSSARAIPIRGGKAYVYKVGKGGKPAKKQAGALGSVAAVGFSPRLTKIQSLRPGAKLGSKNVRYVSRGQIAARLVNQGRPSLEGRGFSSYVARGALKNGKPLRPGYIVSYGKPLSKKP